MSTCSFLGHSHHVRDNFLVHAAALVSKRSDGPPRPTHGTGTAPKLSLPSGARVARHDFTVHSRHATSGGTFFGPCPVIFRALDAGTPQGEACWRGRWRHCR